MNHENEILKPQETTRNQARQLAYFTVIIPIPLQNENVCFPQFVCFFQLLTLGGFSDEIAHSTKGRITDTGVWKILFRSVNLFLPPRTGKIVIFLIS